MWEGKKDIWVLWRSNPQSPPCWSPGCFLVTLMALWSPTRSTFSSTVCTLHDNPPPKSMGHYNACSSGLMSFKSLTGPRRPPGCSFHSFLSRRHGSIACGLWFAEGLFEGRGWVVWGVETCGAGDMNRSDLVVEIKMVKKKKRKKESLPLWSQQGVYMSMFWHHFMAKIPCPFDCA